MLSTYNERMNTSDTSVATDLVLGEFSGTRVSLLTDAQFQGLANMPPELEWFASIESVNTRRAYKNDIAGFMAFVGIAAPEEFRVITREIDVVFGRRRHEASKSCALVRIVNGEREIDGRRRGGVAQGVAVVAGDAGRAGEPTREAIGGRHVRWGEHPVAREGLVDGTESLALQRIAERLLTVACKGRPLTRCRRLELEHARCVHFEAGQRDVGGVAFARLP